jgi:hypothetical protein
MGPFLAVVAVPRINKLRVINTLNSSTAAVFPQELFSRFFVSPITSQLNNRITPSGKKAGEKIAWLDLRTAVLGARIYITSCSSTTREVTQYS